MLRQRKSGELHETLTQEEVDGSDYRDSQHARRAIGQFLENVYNRQRLHSALNYKPPAEFEANLLASQSVLRHRRGNVEATCP
ncbi:MAG: transposase [Alphaproteobacteria bacterium]|nr:transposase [Alphaproteobacteria bacterium]